MADEFSKGTPEKQPEKNDGAAYIYRWSYGEQTMFDRQRVREKKGHGGLVFAIIMVLVFLLAFGGLFGVLWLNDSLPFKKNANVGLNMSQVAAIAKPATVLIYSADTSSYGSGFFITSSGYIVTNYHVIQGATNISVTTYGGKEYAATVRGASEQDDIAVLKVNGIGFSYLEIGNSDLVSDGEMVVAVGNPGGTICTWTTTQGIISSSDRTIASQSSTYILEAKMIQTDAAVNPGNSGGPLCNDRGEVIGIITRKLTDAEGIGLAIPINGASEIVNEIIRTGNADAVTSKVTRIRPLIGVTGSTIAKGEEIFFTGGGSFITSHAGVLVSSITAGGSADGVLEIGDIIFGIDGKTVSTMEQFVEYLYGYKIGDSIRLDIDRQGTVKWVTIVVGKSGNS